jgi:hypothetical protein
LKTKNKKKIVVVVCPSSSSDCFFFWFFSLSELHFWLLYYCCCCYYVAEFLFFLFECHQWERGEGIERTDYRGAIVVIVVLFFFSLEFRRVFCVLVLVTDDELASLCLFSLRCLVRKKMSSSSSR